jgi:hypothetical protein
MKTTIEYLEEALEETEDAIELASDSERPSYSMVPEYLGAKRAILALIRKVKKDQADELATSSFSNAVKLMFKSTDIKLKPNHDTGKSQLRNNSV